MNRIVRIIFYILSISPLIAYLLKKFFDPNINYYWTVSIIFSIYSILFLLLYSKKPLIIPKYLYLFIAAALYYEIRIAYEGYEAYGGFLKYLYKNPALSISIVLLLIENIKVSKTQIENIFKILTVTLLLATIVVLIQVTIDNKFLMPNDPNFLMNPYSDWGRYRFPSLFAYVGQNDYGISFLAIFSIWLGYRIWENKGLKYTTYLMTILATICVFFSGTRYIMLTFVIILLQYFIKKRNNPKLIIISMLSILIIFVGAYEIIDLIKFNFGGFVAQRLYSKTYLSREIALENFLYFYPSNPIFGTGQRVTSSLAVALQGSSQIHIGWLSHLFEFGLVGSLLTFSAWFLLLKKLWLTAKISGYFGSLFAFITFIVANFTFPQYSPYFYGLILAFLFEKYFRSNYPLQEKVQ